MGRKRIDRQPHCITSFLSNIFVDDWMAPEVEFIDQNENVLLAGAIILAMLFS